MPMSLFNPSRDEVRTFFFEAWAKFKLAQTLTDLEKNALGVMHAVEDLQNVVQPTGLIGVMSSGQGSIANNMNGVNDLYRSSKAALNQLMKSYAARHARDQRSLVLMAPGWIRTDLGGPSAPFGMEEAIPEVVNVLLAQQGMPGLRFVDRAGNAVPW